jgi:CheY-like chemotaxis protein
MFMLAPAVTTRCAARRGDRISFVSQAPLVLVADDHDDSRAIARVVLENAGFRVVEARTGPETLQVVRSDRPAIVLLDIVMPELNGWEVARRLRADPVCRDTILIAVTALASAQDREVTIAAGCDELLTKPVLPRLLVATLKYYASYDAI